MATRSLLLNDLQPNATDALVIRPQWPNAGAAARWVFEQRFREVVRVVNTALIELYWAIGKAILDRSCPTGCGARVARALGGLLSVVDGRLPRVMMTNALISSVDPCRPGYHLRITTLMRLSPPVSLVPLDVDALGGLELV